MVVHCNKVMRMIYEGDCSEMTTETDTVLAQQKRAFEILESVFTPYDLSRNGSHLSESSRRFKAGVLKIQLDLAYERGEISFQPDSIAFEEFTELVNHRTGDLMSLYNFAERIINAQHNGNTAALKEITEKMIRLNRFHERYFDPLRSEVQDVPLGSLVDVIEAAEESGPTFDIRTRGDAVSLANEYGNVKGKGSIGQKQPVPSQNKDDVNTGGNIPKDPVISHAKSKQHGATKHHSRVGKARRNLFNR